MAIESSNEPEAFQSFEHQGWQSVGRGYEKHFARVTSQAAPVLVEKVAPAMHVLDVCTGPGMLASAAIERGAEVTGIDHSGTMLALARKNVPTAVFQEADAQRLPFEDNTFDAVLCGLGVIHVPEPAKALSEMCRVLKDGGQAAISVWEAPNPNNGFGLLFSAIKAYGNLNVPLPHGPDIFQFSHEESMAAALEATGFGGVTVEPANASWDLSDPREIITALLEGTVRTRGLLNAQSDKQRDSIIDAVTIAMERYASGVGFIVPMPMLVGRGIKQS